MAYRGLIREAAECPVRIHGTAWSAEGRAGSLLSWTGGEGCGGTSECTARGRLRMGYRRPAAFCAAFFWRRGRRDLFFGGSFAFFTELPDAPAAAGEAVLPAGAVGVVSFFSAISFCFGKCANLNSTVACSGTVRGIGVPKGLRFRCPACGFRYRLPEVAALRGIWAERRAGDLFGVYSAHGRSPDSPEHEDSPGGIRAGDSGDGCGRLGLLHVCRG